MVKNFEHLTSIVGISWKMIYRIGKYEPPLCYIVG
jgi:hypothetical protein